MWAILHSHSLSGSSYSLVLGVLYECIGYMNCTKNTFSHQRKKYRCKYITFSPTSVLSVTKIESVNCGQANVKVTEIKTEIKRGDSNTVKPPDLPFQ